MGTALLKKGEEGPITQGQRDILDVFEKESHRLTGLVNSLLDLPKWKRE
jgi:hypothetical protein